MREQSTVARYPLGASGLQVAPLAFGGNVFGWTADEAMSFRLLDAFVDAGFNLLDTADVYSRWVPGHTGGESESIIGRWLAARGRRERVLIATKVGMDMGGADTGLSRDYILRAVERSLQRLRTDYIDLYQAHRDDPRTPLEETLAAFDALVKSGKVRAIGASNYGPARLAEALAVSRRLGLVRYCCLQPHYNLYERSDYESGLAALCRAEGLAVIPYFSLASGFLTGKYRTEADLAQRARADGVRRMLNARGLRILAALDQVAREHAATAAQVALRWLLAQGVTAPIASATDLAQLQELLRAPSLTLTAQDLRTLDLASAPGAVAD
jgi:aryl-alcohol dehydrogenase-like predicted oxidoreductase